MQTQTAPVHKDPPFHLVPVSFPNLVWERTERDKIIGQPFQQTGMTAVYLGPLLNLTLGGHFSANAGVDFPLSIYNHQIQTVPDYRVHGGFSWRF